MLDNEPSGETDGAQTHPDVVSAANATDTDTAPWTVVKSNDKKRARLEAMRHVLSTIDYDGKDRQVVGQPDPNIVGRAAELFEDDEGLASPRP